MKVHCRRLQILCDRARSAPPVRTGVIVEEPGLHEEGRCAASSSTNNSYRQSIDGGFPLGQSRPEGERQMTWKDIDCARHRAVRLRHVDRILPPLIVAPAAAFWLLVQRSKYLVVLRPWYLSGGRPDRDDRKRPDSNKGLKPMRFHKITCQSRPGRCCSHPCRGAESAVSEATPT
jgi:hypothetical protein